jgi:hypothetical protein
MQMRKQGYRRGISRRLYTVHICGLRYKAIVARRSARAQGSQGVEMERRPIEKRLHEAGKERGKKERRMLSGQGTQTLPGIGSIEGVREWLHERPGEPRRVMGLGTPKPEPE